MFQFHQLFTSSFFCTRFWFKEFLDLQFVVFCKLRRAKIPYKFVGEIHFRSQVHSFHSIQQGITVFSSRSDQRLNPKKFYLKATDLKQNIVLSKCWQKRFFPKKKDFFHDVIKKIFSFEPVVAFLWEIYKYVRKS